MLLVVNLIKFTGLFLLVVPLLLPAAALAQSEPLTFKNLTAELWPEYDRQSVLVIYRAELADAVSLPAQVTFRFPPHVDSLHAIAVERNGGLFSIDEGAIDMNTTDEALVLTLQVDSPRIHLEYYDPTLLIREETDRQLLFNFSADHAIESTTFQVQEPLQSQNFVITPPAGSSFSDSNGFQYYPINIAGLAPGDTVQINATYSRDTDQTSIAILEASRPAPQGSSVSVITDEPVVESGLNLGALGYILVGGGVALLLAAGGYWWWTNRAMATAGGPAPARRKAAARRQVHRKKKAAGPKAPPSEAGKQAAGYCYKCGVALRPDGNFCHVCGAERRTI